MGRCMGKKMQGKEAEPRPIGKIKRDNFYIPDCPDYKPRIDIPIRVKMDEVFAGWNCRNCRNFK